MSIHQLTEISEDNNFSLRWAKSNIKIEAWDTDVSRSFIVYCCFIHNFLLFTRFIIEIYLYVYCIMYMYMIYVVISSSLSSFSKLTINHFFLKTWCRGIFCFSWRTFVVKVLFSSNVEIRYKNSTPFMLVFLIIVVLDIQWSGLLKTISFLIFGRRRSFFYEEKPAYYRNIYCYCLRYCVVDSNCQKYY